MTVYINGTTGYSGPVGVLGDLTTTGNTILGDQSTDTLNVANGNLVLNSSGNAGLGVTPAAWLTYTTLQIKDSALSAINNNQVVLSQNGVYTTGSAWQYINTNFATLYQQYAGNHNWQIAPSGTAGNPITFTTAMTLNASGNLGLGTTPSAWGGPFDVIQLGTYGQYLGGQSNAPDIKVGANQYYNGTNYVYTVTGSGAAQHNISGTTGYQWQIAGTGTAGSTITFSQIMTLDTGGNLGVGTTTPSSYGKLAVAGNAALNTNGQLKFYNSANNNWSYIDNPSTDGTAFLRFAVGAGVAMSITANGDVGIGRTDPPMKLGVSTAGSVISGTATIGTNMQGIQVYNTNSAITNNAVGIWFPTGPHQAGIASFRPNAEAGWATALAFYTHGTATSNLTDCYERMRIDGEGNLCVGGAGGASRVHVQGTSAAIALDSFRPNDGFSRSVEVCYGQSGGFTILTIEVDLIAAGGWCYELNTGGTGGGFGATGGGYINDPANFGHTLHTSGGNGSLVVSAPSGNRVRFVLTGGIGVHPVCTFKITGSLNQSFTAANITVVFS